MCAQHVSRVLSPPASTRFARRRALRAPEPRPHLWAHLTVTSQVEIDQINKPFLPVAACRISPKMAWALVIGSGAFCRPSVRPVPPPSTGAPCARAAGYGLPVQWCTYCGTYCGACRCGGLGGGQGGLQPADLLAVPLRHHRRWAVLGASLPGKPRPVSARLPTPPPLRVPPLPLPHGPAAAACGVRRGAQTQAAPTGGLAIPTMHTLPTERAHSLYS